VVAVLGDCGRSRWHGFGYCFTVKEDTMAKLAEKPVGTCPACGESVFNSRESDGLVWTCPADLSPDNPYWEPPLEQFDTMTEKQREKIGYFGNCREDGYSDENGCYERMPLHSKCYDRGEY